MFGSVTFCHARLLFCNVLLCHVVFCRVRRGRKAGHPGLSGTLGTTWGLAAAVCRVGLAGGSVLEIEQPQPVGWEKNKNQRQQRGTGTPGTTGGLAAAVCRVGLAGGAGHPGSSGITGTTWGLAAAVCRVGLAGGAVLEI